MTDKISEERKERVFRSMKKLTAYREIQNLMGRCAAACNFKQVQKIYAYFSERVDISCEIADEGLFHGREGVKAILNMVFGGEAEPGNMLDIQLTSPMIEVAGDLQTARGVWWTAGATSVPMGSKDPQALWVWGAVAVDFIWEEKEWNLWHVHYFRWIKCDYHKGWADDTSLVNRPNTAMHPLSKPSTYHNPYTPLSIRDGIPPCPRPYDTWTDDNWMLCRDKTK